MTDWNDLIQGSVRSGRIRANPSKNGLQSARIPHLAQLASIVTAAVSPVSIIGISLLVHCPELSRAKLNNAKEVFFI